LQQEPHGAVAEQGVDAQRMIAPGLVVLPAVAGQRAVVDWAAGVEHVLAVGPLTVERSPASGVLQNDQRVGCAVGDLGDRDRAFVNKHAVHVRPLQAAKAEAAAVVGKSQIVAGVPVAVAVDVAGGRSGAIGGQPGGAGAEIQGNDRTGGGAVFSTVV